MVSRAIDVHWGMHMSHARALPILVVWALATSACGTAGDTGGDAPAPILPPAPDVAAVVAQAPEFPDDGRHRVVLSPAPVAAFELSGLPWIKDLGEVGPAIIGRLPDAATLIERDGLLGYVEPGVDGADVFVPVAAIGRAVEAATTASDSAYGHPVIDELAARTEVERLAPIGDGTFAAVMTDLGVLDEYGVAYREEAALALTTEPLEPYQWAHANDGTNLNDVGISPLPLQVTDSDADVVEVDGVATGAGVVVAVVDSGVDFSHPDLEHAQWRNTRETCGNGVDDDQNGYVDDCTGWDFADDDNQPWAQTHNPHGTHVAGIIAAAADNSIGVAGVAPDVEIMDLSVSSDPGGGSITASSIARAIRYATDNGADVVNLSLGTSPGAPVEAVQPIINAVEYAESRGVLLVAAAGNNGVDIDSAAVYPASTPTSNMIAVGASTPGEVRADFSNHGSTVDIFAPGHYILSTTPGNDYRFMSGTSQAAPMVTAIAALYLEVAPGTDPVGVTDQLVGTGDEVDTYTGFAASGVRVNAARAVGELPDFGRDASNAHVVIRGLAHADESGVDADIAMYLPGGQFNEPFHWEAGLVTLRPEGVFGLVGHAIRVDDRTETTDGRGSVSLADRDASEVSISTVLPAGTYGLVVEAVPDTDPTVRLGQAFIATFTIGDPTAPQPDQGSAPDDAPPTNAETPDGGDVVDGGADQPEAASGEQSPSDEGAADAPAGQPADPTAPPSGPSGPVDAPEDAAGGGSVTPTESTEELGNADAIGNAEDVGGVEEVVSAEPVDDAPAGVEMPAPVAPDAMLWSAVDISPRVGPVMAEMPVTIVGTFPQPISVWFGDQPGHVFFQSETLILVATPMRSQAGYVDVVFRTPADEEVMAISDGFLFVDDEEPPADVVEPIDPVTVVIGDTGPPAPGPLGDGSSAGLVDPPGDETVIVIEEPVIDPLPSPDPVAPPAAESEADAGDEPIIDLDPSPGLPGPDVDPESSPDAGPVPQRQSRSAIVGPQVDLVGGLTGTPLDGLSALGDVPACSSDPCRTRRIGA
jgi:subtilisin family serine protease